MRTGTIISLGASAALGVGALVVARIWLPHSTHGGAEANAAAAVPMTPVVVARGPIPYGAKLDAAKLQVTQLPKGAVPQGAYSTVAQVINQPGGAPVALTPIVAREAILQNQLSGGGAKPTLAAVISDGMRGFTIGVNDVAGGGGHILPGDHVDVVLTYDLSTLGGSTVVGKRLVSTVVIQDVKVLGMDLNADPSSTQAVVAHTATLEVSVQNAQRLALASQAGALSLALRRTGAAEVAPARIVNVADVTFGAARGALARTRSTLVSVRHRPVPRLLPAFSGPQSIVVVHGDASTSVSVPADHRSGV